MTRDLAKNLRGKLRLRENIERRAVKVILENYKVALDAIRADLLKVYSKYASDGKLSHAEMSKFNRLTKLEKQLTDHIRPIFSRNQALINKLAKVQYEASYYHTSWAITQRAGVELNWGLLNTDTVAATVGATDDYSLISDPKTRELAAYNNKLRYQAFRGLRDDGIISLQRTLTQGITRGKSYRQMIGDVKSALNKNADSAIRIIRTEGTRVQTMGQTASYDRASDLGVNVVRVWDATLDTNTRPRHAALDGKEANDDGLFRTPVGLVEGPGLSGVPSFDINCRCRVSARIDDYSPKVRRSREDGVIPYQTFEQWAKDKGINRSKYGARYKF